jgi:hypothetical protein
MPQTGARDRPRAVTLLQTFDLRETVVSSSADLSAAYITGSIAALAIVASTISTWITLRYQRTLAQDERLFNHRADAYERLLRYQHENPAFSGLLPAEVASRLNAYGSEDVHQKVRDVRAAAADPDSLDALLGQIRFELQVKRDRSRLHSSTRWQPRLK